VIYTVKVLRMIYIRSKPPPLPFNNESGNSDLREGDEAVYVKGRVESIISVRVLIHHREVDLLLIKKQFPHFLFGDFLHVAYCRFEAYHASSCCRTTSSQSRPRTLLI
jgi:hypothetical protein